MLPSRKALKPPGLQGSTAKAMARGPASATSLCLPLSPMSYHDLSRRNFSWGAKHKLESKNAGKVWKGFSTHDHTRSRTQLYRGTFWNHYCVSRFHPFFPVQDWRLTSSWGKSATPYTRAGQTSVPKTQAQETMEQDRYCNHQQEKKKHYDVFMKKMEDDPIGMLFGRRWANWIDGAEAKIANATASRAITGNDPPENKKLSSELVYGRMTASVNTSREQHGTDREHASSVGDQSLEKDYEIDPITNRRVQRIRLPADSKSSPSKSLPRMAKVASKPIISHTAKSTPQPNTSAGIATQKTGESLDVPVRPFVSPTANPLPILQTNSGSTSTQPELERPKVPSAQKPKSWLAQEGFSLKRGDDLVAQWRPFTLDAYPKAANPRIESALERHVQNKCFHQAELSRQTLQYDPTENTIEDVDLLRPSDVRASAGLRRKVPKECDEEKGLRQRKLEEEHQIRNICRESQLAEELAATAPQQRLKSRREPPIGQGSSESMLETGALAENCNEYKARPIDWANEISDAEGAPEPKSSDVVKQSVGAVISEKGYKIRAQLVPLKARLDAMKADYDRLRQRWLDEKRRKGERAAKEARDIHEEEVKAQKTAMDAIELRGAEHTSKQNIAPAQRTGSVIPSDPNQDRRRLHSLLPGEGDMASNVHEFANRDRWYKRKAPHAKDELAAKFQRLAKDNALVQEIRDIYENTYGTINTSHRQPPQGEEVPKPPSVPESHASPTSSDSLPSSTSDHSSARAESYPPSNAEISQPWQALHSPVKGKAPASDPLLVIQKVFDEVRQAQPLIEEHLTTPQHSEALVLIQKLFGTLRRIQSIIRLYRTLMRQASSPAEAASTLQLLRRACDPYTDMKSKSAKEVAHLNEGVCGADCFPELEVDRPLASESFEPLTIYRVLVFDVVEQKLVSSKATSLAPFQPLFPLKELRLINFPGEFLPALKTLHDTSFTLVAGKTNTLVFQKPADAQEFDDSEREQSEKGSNNVHSVKECRWNADGHESEMCRMITEAVGGRQHDDGIGSTTPPSTSPLPSRSTNSGSTATEASSTESMTSNSAKRAEPSRVSNQPSSSNVRREEAVFSGRSRGHWQETERKRTSRKQRRAENQSRRSKLKNILVTGTATAALCYAIGVISQMIQH